MERHYAFPRAVPFSDSELRRSFWRCLHTRCQDRAFHFDILLPIDWRPVDVPAEPPTAERPLTTLALFRTLANRRAEIEVIAALLTREIAPGDWLDCQLEHRREEILHRRDTDTDGGVVSDVLSRLATPEGLLISRCLAIKDGRHLFVLHARVMDAHYGAFADVFFMAVAGFELLHQGKWPLAESLKTFSQRYPGDFLMMYPESWMSAQDPQNTLAALTLNLRHQVDDKTFGQITVAVVSRAAETEPQRLADKYVEQLKVHGVPVDTMRLVPTLVTAGVEAAWQAVEDAAGPRGSAEIRLVVRQRPDAWYLFGLLGPSRDTAAEIWAVNKRAFEIVLTYWRTPSLPAAASC
jgi:hypothetical protein